MCCWIWHAAFFDLKTVYLAPMWCDFDTSDVDWWWFQCYRRFFCSWYVWTCIPGVTVLWIVGLPVDYIKLQESISGFHHKADKMCDLLGYYAG